MLDNEGNSLPVLKSFLFVICWHGGTSCASFLILFSLIDFMECLGFS